MSCVKEFDLFFLIPNPPTIHFNKNELENTHYTNNSNGNIFKLTINNDNRCNSNTNSNSFRNSSNSSNLVRRLPSPVLRHFETAEISPTKILNLTERLRQWWDSNSNRVYRTFRI